MYIYICIYWYAYMYKYSKGKVGYPWESTRDIYQHIPPIYGLYNGFMEQYGVIFWEKLLGYLPKGTQLFPLKYMYYMCKHKYIYIYTQHLPTQHYESRTSPITTSHHPAEPGTWWLAPPQPIRFERSERLLLGTFRLAFLWRSLGHHDPSKIHPKYLIFMIHGHHGPCNYSSFWSNSAPTKVKSGRLTNN